MNKQIIVKHCKTDDEAPKEKQRCRKTCVYLKTFWNVQLLAYYLKIIFRKLEKRK